tara:strand:+ start:461 stop:667 length:207 start_codon:yes stop_codon:yes gene_type:complete
MISRHRKTDAGIALNKLKVSSIKILRNYLKTGSAEQKILSAEKVLALLHKYDSFDAVAEMISVESQSI